MLNGCSYFNQVSVRVIKSNYLLPPTVCHQVIDVFGFRVGVRRETIGKLENGRYNPSLKLAMDIAKVFGKTVEEVFEFQEEE